MVQRLAYSTPLFCCSGNTFSFIPTAQSVPTLGRSGLNSLMIVGFLLHQVNGK